MMGASDVLGGNLGCGSVRPPPDGPMKTDFEVSLFGNCLWNFWDTILRRVIRFSPDVEKGGYGEVNFLVSNNPGGIRGGVFLYGRPEADKGDRS